MGMVGYVTRSSAAIGEVVSVVLFVVATLVVNNKMKRIFNQIVHKGSRRGSSRPADDGALELTRESQLKLFWQAEPRLVISILRFMEVGYTRCTLRFYLSSGKTWEANDSPFDMLLHLYLGSIKDSA
jgi:hypothetical protein